MTTLVSSLAIPSPGRGVWHLGPFPIRAYALCIIVGIIVAIVISERRWVARGGKAGEMQDLALWAVPFGLVGGRLYHVITDNELYFGEGRHPIQALYVWRGGLGIWGAIALGAVGVVIGAKLKGIRILPAIDTMAPGAVVAQAIGRWGNYFNQELYGRETDLPWKLEITKDSTGNTVPATYHHPTFLYECLWDLGVFGLLIWAERRFKLGYGRVMALYIMGYTLGRGWIENLRVDTVQMDDVLGLRLNVWTSIVLFLVGAAWFTWSALRRPGRETSVYVNPTPVEEAGDQPPVDSGDQPPVELVETRSTEEAGDQPPVELVEAKTAETQPAETPEEGTGDD